MSKIAVIGAGLSGLVLARELSPYADITLFEKARGVSGRMSTRYADPYQFDHGAQFFTAKTDPFKQFLAPLIEKGVVGRWDARFVELTGSEVTASREWGAEDPRYVGIPQMNQISKYLAEELKVELPVRISKIEKHDKHWRLSDEAGEWRGDFDWVISTAPPIQSADMLPKSFIHHAALQEAKMSGCFTLMLGFEEPLPLLWDAALVHNSDIGWISVNSSKPGRPESYALLVNSTNSWADQHLADDREAIKSYLCKEASRVIGLDVMQANHIVLHFWAYANIGKQKGEKALLDEENKLAACGDWCIQGRVEAAFTSAMHLANQLKAYL